MVNDLDLDAQNYSKVVGGDEGFFYLRVDGEHRVYSVAGDANRICEGIVEVADNEDGVLDMLLSCMAWIVKDKKIDFNKYLDESLHSKSIHEGEQGE